MLTQIQLITPINTITIIIIRPDESADSAAAIDSSSEQDISNG
jgi:hypothetical protein